jgi:hypothetical protein
MMPHALHRSNEATAVQSWNVEAFSAALDKRSF